MRLTPVLFVFAVVAILTHAVLDTVFEPTDEWQEIQRDQHIPAGLEVRLDLSSGKRLARNAQKTSTPGRALVVQDATVSEAELDSSSDDPLFVHSAALSALPPDARKVAEVLLGLPDSAPVVSDILSSGVTGAPLAHRLRQVWATRQAELEEAMAGMQTEGQIVQELLSELVNTRAATNGSVESLVADVSRKVSLLRDLEYHVTGVINAEDFVNMGGLPVLFKAMEHDPSLNVAMHAAWVLGTAVKNHATLQLNASRLGAMLAVTRLLRRAVEASRELSLATAHLVVPGDYPIALMNRAESAIALVGEGDATLPLQALSKGVYALGALLRRCPEAQREFELLSGGLVLSDVLQASSIGAWQGHARVRTGIVSPNDASSTDAVHSSALFSRVEVSTRGGRRLAHAGRTLCAKVITLIADLHSDTLYAAEEGAEDMEQERSITYNERSIKVTLKGDAPFKSSGPLVTFVGPAAQHQRHTCAHVQDALSHALRVPGGALDAEPAQQLPLHLRELYLAAVPEGERLQSAALDKALQEARAIVLPACSDSAVASVSSQ